MFNHIKVCKKGYFAPSAVEPCIKCPEGKSNSGATFAVGVIVVVLIIILLFVKCYRDLDEFERDIGNFDNISEPNPDTKEEFDVKDDDAGEYGGKTNYNMKALFLQLVTISSFKSTFN